jgi:anti-sigma regulatory factor (Ser/Thr protein kinase)
MDNPTYISYLVDDRSYFSLLKKDINKKAGLAGFSAKKLDRLDIIVAEMTSNLLKYAEKGELLVCVTGEEEHEYVELIAIDNGPGIANPERMMLDGVSTASTSGSGLGSIKRLSDFFEVYSLQGWGTIMLCRLFKHAKPKATYKNIVVRSITVAKPGEVVSGDGGVCLITPDYFKLLVADGLGHGVEANQAVREAAAAFKTCEDHDPVEIIKCIHESIKKTRGAVGTVIVFDFKSKVWKIAGVGNIATTMMNYQKAKSLMSYNGIIGHNIPAFMKAQEISINEFQRIVLCSDGLKTRWDTNKYEDINKYDLSILAAALYKDNAKKTDDMSVIVCRA